MYTVTEQGTYWVTVTGACNAVTDSINIDLPPAISVDLGNDTIVCEGEIVSIDATTSGVDYLWQDGSTDPIYFAALPGAYIVEVSNDCQTGTDTLNVGHLPVPIVYLGNDTVLCGQHNLTLDAENPGSTYEWFNGTNTQMVSVTTTGTYYVAVTNPDGCVGYDTIDIGFEMPTLVSLGSDTTIVDGSTLVLDAGPGFTYEWSTGETAQQITVDSAGTYTVIITDENGCTDVDHIQVDVVSSIAENSLVGQISVYPSLVSDFVMVDFKSSTTGRAEIQVFNMNGVSLFQREVEASALQFSIDFGHFPSGMYIVKVSLETGALMEKVVKIR